MEGQNLRVMDMPVSLRPRERLEKFGPGVLSDGDLLAVILGSGGKNGNVLMLGCSILKEFEGLEQLSRAEMAELRRIRGIGPAKASVLAAAFEIGRRVASRSSHSRVRIRQPQDAAELLIPGMRNLSKEYFKALVLNIKNEVTKQVNISIGSLNASIVHPRELYKEVLKHNGASVIIAHNHPSGDPAPSGEDIELTHRLNKAGKILGIKLLDHIIIGDGSFISLKEMGILE